MTENYWTKGDRRNEIITQTQISNKLNFRLNANYYNILEQSGLSFQFNKEIDFQANVYSKQNGFEYFVIEHENVKELYILPNENLLNYTERIISKINSCKTESEVLSLLLKVM